MDEVKFYAVGRLASEVYFPNGRICCGFCRYRRYKSVNGHVNEICVKTCEALNGIDVFKSRGGDCPLEIQEEIRDGNHSKREKQY